MKITPREEGDTIKEQPRPGDEVGAVKRPLSRVAIFTHRHRVNFKGNEGEN